MKGVDSTVQSAAHMDVSHAVCRKAPQTLLLRCLSVIALLCQSCEGKGSFEKSEILLFKLTMQPPYSLRI